VPEDRAEALQQALERGAVLLGVHVRPGDVAGVRTALSAAGATELVTANWRDEGAV
jgi:hypothetical protein